MAKPVVDGLEKELEGRAAVLRVSVADSIGRQLAARYSVRAVPTFVLLDGDGSVALTHAGAPDRDEITTALDRLQDQ